jgi:hypothetical protein
MEEQDRSAVPLLRRCIDGWKRIGAVTGTPPTAPHLTMTNYEKIYRRRRRHVIKPMNPRRMTFEGSGRATGGITTP